MTSADPVTALASENFIQLLKVQDGKKQEEVKYPTYGELGKTLARRTYDESGDYTITPFNLDLKAHRGISGQRLMLVLRVLQYMETILYF